MREMQKRSDKSCIVSDRHVLMSQQAKKTVKLCKSKKNALNFMDQIVMQRLSDYFSYWKLKVLLG